MVVRVENLSKIAEELERQEIINAGALSNTEYAKLLAIYLYKNDLISAKFLWKRIPLATKSALTELEFIWRVGKAMRKRDYPEVYTALRFSWSAEIMPIMQMVEEEIRKNTVILIGKSYSSLALSTLGKYVGYDVQNTKNLATQHGWTFDDTYVFPTPVAEEVQDNRGDFNAFKKLTDSISFLEN
ncbi:COP9 signalosome complex subunit 8 [Planococcus citri]|uniref:COP9 signalosome complex subunit 8 n=1 Tax=Planococcus citri TaxID=170843 RepID=UPI0031F800EF